VAERPPEFESFSFFAKKENLGKERNISLETKEQLKFSVPALHASIGALIFGLKFRTVHIVWLTRKLRQ